MALHIIAEISDELWNILIVIWSNWVIWTELAFLSHDFRKCQLLLHAERDAESFCSFAVFCHGQNSYKCMSLVWFLSSCKYFWKCTIKGRVTIDDNEMICIYIHTSSPNTPALILYILCYKLPPSSFCPFCHPLLLLFIVPSNCCCWLPLHIHR